MDTPEAPPAPAPSPASSAPSPAPAAPSPAPSAPSPWSRPAPDRVRSNVRMAGVAMVMGGIFIAFFSYQPIPTADHTFTDDEVRPFADRPGGPISVDAPAAGAAVTVYSLNGTKLADAETDAQGHALLDATRTGVRVQVAGNGTTWTRKVLTFPGYASEVRLDGSSPADSDAWVQPDLSGLRWLWAIVAAALFVAAAGVMAFRLRGHRIATAGAWLLLVGSAALLVLSVSGGAVSLGVLLQPLILTAMGAFAVWAFRAGRDRFTPVRLGGLQL